MDLDEMSTLYRGLSIDASYQVSLHLAEGFQRRRLKCEKLTDARRQTPSDGKSSHCLWQGELKWGGGIVSTYTNSQECKRYAIQNYFCTFENVKNKRNKTKCFNITY
jgi:hypothetical protein